MLFVFFEKPTALPRAGRRGAFAHTLRGLAPVFAGTPIRFVLRHGMAFEYEKRQAMRMLQGIENGSMKAWQSRDLLEDADPTLVYFVFTWLRAHYPPSHSAAEGVLGRLAEICTRHPTIPRRVKAGAADPLVDWFEGAYSYRDFDRRAFIDLVVEKLEG